MADPFDLLSRYGYSDQAPDPGDSLDYALYGPRPPITTREIAGFMPQDSIGQRGLRSAADILRSFARGLNEFDRAQPPTRLNANAASLPGALSNTKTDRDRPSLEDLLKRYGSSF